MMVTSSSFSISSPISETSEGDQPTQRASEYSRVKRTPVDADKRLELRLLVCRAVRLAEQVVCTPAWRERQHTVENYERVILTQKLSDRIRDGVLEVHLRTPAKVSESGAAVALWQRYQSEHNWNKIAASQRSRPQTANQVRGGAHGVQVAPILSP